MLGYIALGGGNRLTIRRWLGRGKALGVGPFVEGQVGSLLCLRSMLSKHSSCSYRYANQIGSIRSTTNERAARMSDFDPRGYLNDVYAKAGPATSRAAAEALEAAGAIIVAVATVVDRNTGAQQVIEAKGYKYLSAVGLEDLGLA